MEESAPILNSQQMQGNLCLFEPTLISMVLFSFFAHIFIFGISGSRTKWILLFEYCFLAFLQGSVFLSWNSIANSVLFTFSENWTSSTLAWQINLATITSPFIQYPVWMSLKRFNLSKTIVWGAALPLVISTFLSSLPIFFGDVSSETYKILSFGSFLFTGITGVVFFSSITRFSSMWFSEGDNFEYYQLPRLR